MTHLLAAQVKQKPGYDQTVVLGTFQQVLARALLFPRQATQEWEGPFAVNKVLGPVTYKVPCGPRPNQLKTFHVNHLKWWHEPTTTVSTVA